MIIHRGYEGLNLRNPVVATGIFDGVHRGHTELLARVKATAESIGGVSVAMTFKPHPRRVVDPDNNELYLLSTLEEKIELLEKSGIDDLIIVDFSKEFSKITATDFVREILLNKIGARGLILGYDHRFGNSESETASSIDHYAVKLGLIIQRVNSVLVDSLIVSSSAIRELLINGDITLSNKLLGYDYSLSGRVVGGEKLGQKIGFPTANIEVNDKYKLVPADGVYAVRVELHNNLMGGVLSIGNNPTVSNKGKTTIEVNIFDFDQNIYGEPIKISFVKRLRDLRKFNDINQLSEQIAIDRKIAMDLLGK